MNTEIKVGDIIKVSIPCYPRYIYLKIIEIKKEYTSNFGVEFIDCLVEEVGIRKLREGKREHTFKKSEMWIVSEKEVTNV